jgi:hypothetical protein
MTQRSTRDIHDFSDGGFGNTFAFCFSKLDSVITFVEARYEPDLRE